MTNLEKFNTVFMDTFRITEDKLTAELSILTLENWDSLAQMNLITALEDAFNIMMEPDDIIELSSYEGAKNILEKYDIIF